MELDFALLAEAATAGTDGKMNLLGCGYDIFVSTAVPLTVPRITLAIRFLFRPAETEIPAQIEILLIDGDGNPLLPKQVGSIESRKGRLSGAIVPYPLILEFTSVTFPKHGPYSFEILVEGKLVKSVPLYVVPGL